MTSSIATSLPFIGNLIRRRTKASSEPDEAQTATDSRKTVPTPSLSSKMYRMTTCSDVDVQLPSSQEEPCRPVTPKTKAQNPIASKPRDIRQYQTTKSAPLSRSADPHGPACEARAKSENQKPSHRPHRYERFGAHTPQGRTLRWVRGEGQGAVVGKKEDAR
jgi:hypothetical protein